AATVAATRRGLLGEHEHERGRLQIRHVVAGQPLGQTQLVLAAIPLVVLVQPPRLDAPDAVGLELVRHAAQFVAPAVPAGEVDRGHCDRPPPCCCWASTAACRLAAFTTSVLASRT